MDINCLLWKIGSGRMPLYKGIFNYSCEMVIKYTHAPSPKAAKMRMINQLAKDHGVHASVVYGIFDGSKDNYRIEEEKHVVNNENKKR